MSILTSDCAGYEFLVLWSNKVRLTMPSEVLENLSPRARAWVHAQPLARRSQWTLTDGELRELLEALDLPYSDEMAEFERNVGGWCHAEDVELKGFGFGIALRQGPGRPSSPIAKELSSWRDVFEGPLEPDDSGPLVGLGYPHVFFRDVQLVPFGMRREEHAYFVAASGTIYRYWTLGDELRAEAGDCISWLESSALEAERMSWCQVHISADLTTLSAQLGCEERPVVQDSVQTSWASIDTHVSIMLAGAPNERGTIVACRDPKKFAAIVQSVMLEHPAVRLSGLANGIQGGRGRGALAAVGVEY
jgi:hypothetical protein